MMMFQSCQGNMAATLLTGCSVPPQFSIDTTATILFRVLYMLRVRVINAKPAMSPNKLTSRLSTCDICHFTRPV
jgi:hypothetical protein